MFNLQPMELFVIFILALIVFGPKKLPEIGRSIGHGIREFKKASQSLVDEIERAGEEKPAPAAIASDNSDSDNKEELD